MLSLFFIRMQFKTLLTIPIKRLSNDSPIFPS
jgi:hypothetical protein